MNLVVLFHLGPILCGKQCYLSIAIYNSMIALLTHLLSG